MPLNERIYTLTTGRVLNTNVFQVNLGKLLFRATLKVRLGSCLSTALKIDKLDGTMHISKNSLLVYRRGSSRVEAYIASPTSPPYVGKQLSSFPHTATVDISCLQHCSINSKLCIAQHSKHLATVTN